MCDAQIIVEGRLKVTPDKKQDSFFLVDSKQAADVYFDPDDAKIVHIAADAFRNDVRLVTGILPAFQNDHKQLSSHAVIIGTLGKSEPIDQLVISGKLPIKHIQGKWETFAITVIEKPFEQVEKALVIAGSDRRGTAFGIFELSKMMGVSPWVWWADVTPKHMDTVYIAGSSIIEGPPSVKYRGIFLNDEDWGLQPWAAKNMDPDIRDIGPGTYSKIFELILRLKANYIWPAMHPCTKAFYYYPDNPKVADEYAIVVGASHCEPLLRNNVYEWNVNFEYEYGRKPGPWRYDTNRNEIHRYWEDRVKQAVSFESVFTVGMRGIHDSGMPGGKSQEDKIKLLGKVINEQRELLANNFDKQANEIPQIFCPYKEVLTLYQAGLELPDDVTVVWADDNHGYIRQLSNPEEQRRSGASGVYYHISYWGDPQDYLWLCSTSPALISYEMTKAFRYGATRLWVFNVGDIKPAEMETEFAMDLAWDINSWTPEKAHRYPEIWAARTFGNDLAKPLGRIKSEYYRLAQAGKPEHMNALKFGEDEINERLRDYQVIAAEVETLSRNIPERLQDAFFQLVLYPVQCACLMNEKILYAGQSLRLAQQGDISALEYAQKAEKAFKRIQQLTEQYDEEISDGKWSGMMSWHPRDREVFNMPEFATLEFVKKANGSRNSLEEAQKNLVGERIVISAADFVNKREISAINLEIINGLGIGGKGLTLMPYDAKSISEDNVEKAAFVDYKVNPEPGDRKIIVKCLPTHRLHEGRGLRYAISVNGDVPQIVDIHAYSQSAVWRTNVLRGFSLSQTIHNVSTSGESVIRIYLLDPGLVINAIEVL